MRNDMERVYSVEKQLCIACEEGDYLNVKRLLEHVDIDVNARDESIFGWTPLISACQSGNLQVIQLLLDDERLNVNFGNHFGHSAFYCVCGSGKVDAAKLLMKHKKIDVNSSGVHGFTPLMNASYCGYIEIVKLILASGKEIRLNSINIDQKTALQFAKERRNVQIANLLEAYNNNPNDIRDKLRRELGYLSKNFLSIN